MMGRDGRIHSPLSVFNLVGFMAAAELEGSQAMTLGMILLFCPARGTTTLQLLASSEREEEELPFGSRQSKM